MKTKTQTKKQNKPPERTFEYIAENEAKTVRKKGIKKANNEGEVVGWIYDSGLLPVAISEVKKNKPPKPKQTKLPTPAEVYNHLAKCIRRDANQYRHKQLDSQGRYNTELVGLYTDYWQRLADYIRIDKKYYPKYPLKEIPPINNNPYMGMFELEDLCRTQARIMTDKPKLTKYTPKFENAHLAYERILEIATDNGSISLLDCDALIYESGVENLDIDKYKMPKNFQTWINYLRGYANEHKTIISQLESM